MNEDPAVVTTETEFTKNQNPWSKPSRFQPFINPRGRYPGFFPLSSISYY